MAQTFPVLSSGASVLTMPALAKVLRELKVEDALLYLDQVKMVYRGATDALREPTMLSVRPNVRPNGNPIVMLDDLKFVGLRRQA